MATTPSEPGATPPPVMFEGRLHPFSWMFVLLTQLRQVALPLVFLLFFGRGEWWELFALVGAGALALYSLIYSFGFRYRIGAGELVVREGDASREHLAAGFSHGPAAKRTVAPISSHGTSARKEGLSSASRIRAPPTDPIAETMPSMIAPRQNRLMSLQ